MESGSDVGDEEQPPWFDAPELDLDEGAAGYSDAEPLEDKPPSPANGPRARR